MQISEVDRRCPSWGGGVRHDAWCQSRSFCMSDTAVCVLTSHRLVLVVVLIGNSVSVPWGDVESVVPATLLSLQHDSGVGYALLWRVYGERENYCKSQHFFLGKQRLLFTI